MTAPRLRATLLALLLFAVAGCDRIAAFLPSANPDDYVKTNLEVKGLKLAVAADKRNVSLIGTATNLGDRDLDEAWVLVDLGVKDIDDVLVNVGPIGANSSETVNLHVETLPNDAFVMYYQIRSDSGTFRE